MIDLAKVKLFKELFSQAESVLIIYAGDALRDQLFAATALYKAFQQNTNKSILLLSNKDLSKIEKEIVYLDETKTDIGNQNLCISLDYSFETVEKISSSIDEASKKLHITIKPKKGVAPVSKESVTFSYTGADADMVILIGVDDLESLDQLYLGYEDIYQKTALVSINSYETSFGNLKLDILGSSCTSEYVTQLLRSFQYTIDHETATNLLAGIDEETDNLESYLATADTFEVVSILLRHGARRFAREKQETNLATKYEDDQVFTVPIKKEKSDKFLDEVVIVEKQEQKVESTKKSEYQIQDNLNITSENTTSVPERLKKNKKRRGRPKGSKNKKKSTTQKIKNPKITNSSTKLNQPKPGDLNYVPSGVGPSSGG